MANLDVIAALRSALRIAKAASSGVTGNAPRIKAAEDAIAAVAKLIAAAERVQKLYPRHWDRIDGAAIIMPENVREFDESFAAHNAALAACKPTTK